MTKTKKPLLPPTLLFVFLLLALIIHFLFPTRILDKSFRIIGSPFIFFGVAINIWADNCFKKEKTTVKPHQKPTKLITNGPFQISRHPMYLGFVLILLGLSIVLGSLSSFIAPISMFIILQKKFIPFEEKQMEKTFGEKYLKYKKKVRRWL